MKAFRYTQEMEARYTQQGWWGGATFLDYLDRNARQIPHKEALTDSKNRMTFAQVKQWCDRVALGLLKLGLQKDDVVMVLLPNIAEALLLRFALPKAGIIGTVGPMTLRQRECEYALEYVEAKAIFMVPQFHNFDYWDMIQKIRPNLPHLKHIIIAGDQVPPGAISLKEMAQSPLEEEYPPGHLEKTSMGLHDVIALGMTTGSTGMPKFAEMTHWQTWSGPIRAKAWNITEKDVCAAIASLVGGLGHTIPLFIAPYVGARVVLLERFDGEGALRIIEKERVTVASGVPAQLALMLRHPNFARYDVSSLRVFFCAGAVLPADFAKEVEEKMGCRIVTAFGVLEGCPISLTHYDDPVDVRRASVGRPFPGNEVKLVDEEGRAVPEGGAGEFLVRGPYTAGGLYKDPEGTLKMWGGQKDGWCATGDLGKIDAAGNLHIVGRRKDIIIRGGQNIAPAEVEALLVAHPKIVNVAIVPMPDPVMGEKACACVITKPGLDLTFEEMVSFLKEKGIAPYKLPERLELFDQFPMLADAQKISKRELAAHVAEKLKAEGKI
ncbi:MAG: AMP-binding protein [Desulfobacterales bacterium]|nr:AMP-binding protein [Desulfobacterales bacterium]